MQRLYPVELSLASSTPAAEEVALAAQVDVPSDVQAKKSAANTRALLVVVRFEYYRFTGT